MGSVGYQVPHHVLTGGHWMALAMLINLLVQCHSPWRNKADECGKQKYPFSKWLSKCKVLVLDPLSSWIAKRTP